MRTTMLALFLGSAFIFPSAAHAACNLDNTGGDSPTMDCASGSTGTAGELGNLRRDVQLQASDGVNVSATDDNNDVAVGACHQNGSAGYYGSSGGGSITENTTFDPSGDSTCSGATYADIST